MSKLLSNTKTMDLRVGLLVTTCLVACLSQTASAGSFDGGGAAGGPIIDIDPDTEVKNFSAISGTGFCGVLAGAICVWPGGGTASIHDNGAITGGADGIYVYESFGTKPVTINNNGHILGQGPFQGDGLGIDVTTLTGPINITNNNGIESKADDAIWAKSFGGNILIDNNKDLTGSDAAVLVENRVGALKAGTVTVTNNGSITGNNTVEYGAVNGAVSIFNGDGAVTVQNNGAITGGDDGIDIKTLAGNVLVDGNGAIKANGTVQNFGIGVEVETATGNITVSNNDGVTAVGDDGVWAYSGSGNVAVTNNKNISGNDDAVLATTGGAGTVDVSNNGTLTGKNAVPFGTSGAVTTVAGSGTTTINGNGDITGGSAGRLGDGIAAIATTGNIQIGTAKTNGVTSGTYDGIYASTAGTTNIVVDKNVTGTLHDGMWINSPLSTGANSIDIGAGATVAGATGATYNTSAGIATTTGGTMAITNAGTITTLSDDAAATTIGGIALWNSAGATTVDNNGGGTIIGGLNVTGGPYVLNNNAGAIWTPNSDPVGAQRNYITAQTTVNNAGLINTREGLTYLAAGAVGADVNNKSGGVIDQTYGGTAPKATDSLFVRDFSSAAGSKIVTNVDFTTGQNTGIEHSVGAVVLDTSTNNAGKGTADTIVFGGAFKSAATSLVDLKVVGGAAVGSSGSIALITPYGKSASGKMLDPGLGGYGTIVASTNYVMASDPSTGAVIYKLVEDTNLGLYLQWAPNLSASALGGFGGGVGDAAQSSPGTAIGGASGSLAGVGGVGNSGGPSGGGAAGHIADMAAGNALQTDDITVTQGGSLKDGGAPISVCERSHTAWGVGEASRSNYKGGGDGRAESLSGGVETGLGDIEGRGCNRVAVGVFGFTGSSDTKWSTGSDDSSNDGVGGYIRASSAVGLYATLVGAYNWSDHDLFNGIFNSTANKDASGWVGVGTVGYATRIAPTVALDVRGFASYGQIDGDAFTDRAGITVSGTSDDIVTVGGSAGLYAGITDSSLAFVRGGVKWSQLDSSITAFGVTQTGSVDDVSGSVEGGVIMSASSGVKLGASAFGEFSDSATSYGGRATLDVKF